MLIPHPAANFNYTELPAEIVKDAQFRAEQIRQLSRTTIDCILLVGRHLIEVKKKLQHGQFSDWVESECGFTLRTAENYIRAAAFAEGKNETVALLPPATVYKLAAKSTPPELAQAVIERLEGGATVTQSEIDRALGEARYQKREAARKAEQAARRARKSKAAQAREALELAARQRQQQELHRKIRVKAEMLIDEIGDVHARKIVEVLNGGYGIEALHLIGRVLQDRSARAIGNSDVITDAHPH